MNWKSISLRYFPAFLLTIISLLALNGSSQSVVHFRIKSEIDQLAISYALIYDRTHNIKFMANDNGEAKLFLQDSTLVRISAIAYEDQFYLYSNSHHQDTVELFLSSKVYELKEFVLNPYPTVMLFKKAFADLQLEDTNSIAANLMMLESLKPYAISPDHFNSQDVLTVSFTSPISLLYNSFSKRAKSEKKLQSLTQSDNRANIVKQKYNRELVMKLTGLKEGKYLEDFLVYCEPSFNFVLESSDYEIAMLIQHRYEIFLLNHPN
ncbi:hypothetical protein HNS38_19755 [Lentimicrobium sp. L6]|uniref:hypothetical protein n=1 Tax=Lentimicrobium sp. L6 TaxID=2735916 RepID=UPI00155498CE|nr:hypothetical protein [Lentimicrobium sp. L6]NPD86997.1 hypothetical protein [Lentimicrobium sp. L6]